MILCLFTWHVKQVDDNEYDWGQPVGAMALIAAAVSSRPSSDPGFIFSYHSYRWSAHSLFQRQEHYIKPTQRLPPRRNVITQEANWGAKARARYKQAKEITAELWNVIETNTQAIYDNGDLEAMGDDAGTASSEAGYNPDEMVVWDW